MREHWSELTGETNGERREPHSVVTTLVDAPRGRRVRVVRRKGEREFRASLDGLGIHVGDELLVVKNAPFHGPILVELVESGARVAISLGRAEKIEVEPVEDPEPRCPGNGQTEESSKEGQR